MEWCAREFRLAKRMKDGSSLRDTLLAIPEPVRNDEVRAMLDTGKLPTRLMYLFDAFIDLCRTRASGFNGPEPIGYDQLYYWQRTIGFLLHRWEVDVIYRIDAAWREHFVPKPEKRLKGKEAPSAD